LQDCEKKNLPSSQNYSIDFKIIQQHIEPMAKYTPEQDEFIFLLKYIFNMYEPKPIADDDELRKYKFDGYTQTEVALTAGIDTGQISHMLKASYPYSYEKSIKSLKRLRKLKDLGITDKDLKQRVQQSEKQRKELTSTLKSKEKTIVKQKKLLTVIPLLFVSIALLAGSLLWFTDVFTDKKSPTTLKPVSIDQSTISEYSRQRLFRLLGERNSYKLTILAIIFNERVKQGLITKDIAQTETNNLLKDAINIINENRHQLEDMEIYLSNGKNIAHTIQAVYSPDEITDNFNTILKDILSPDINISGLVESIERTAQNEQQTIERRIDKLLQNPALMPKNLNGCRLTRAERNALTDLYGQHVQYKIALEAIIFHSDLKTGNYKDKDEVNHHLKVLFSKLDSKIEDSRELLERTLLKAENGEYLSDIFRSHSNNNLKENFDQVIPILKNSNMATSRIIDEIMDRISSVQTKNVAKFDSLITSSLPPIIIAN